MLIKFREEASPIFHHLGVFLISLLVVRKPFLRCETGHAYIDILPAPTRYSLQKDNINRMMLSSPRSRVLSFKTIKDVRKELHQCRTKACSKYSLTASIARQSSSLQSRILWRTDSLVGSVRYSLYQTIEFAPDGSRSRQLKPICLVIGVIP